VVLHLHAALPVPGLGPGAQHTAVGMVHVLHVR
jgi:hypothetical protein